MIVLHVFIIITLVICVYFLWVLLHEASHAVLMKIIRPNSKVSIKPYPHKNASGSWLWGSTEWENLGEPPTKKQISWILFAPRFINIFGIIGTGLSAWLLHGHAAWIICLVLGGSAIDLAVGSIGSSSQSDLIRFSLGFRISPWVFRSLGWIVVIGITAITLLGLLLK